MRKTQTIQPPSQEGTHRHQRKKLNRLALVKISHFQDKLTGKGRRSTKIHDATDIIFFRHSACSQKARKAY